MKRIALLLTLALFVTSLSGCGCARRIRGYLCRGAYCGTQTPMLGSVGAPVTRPIVAAPQVVSAPQYMQPQVVTPTCMPCCPTTVCDPCCESTCNDCCGTTSYAGYASGDCGCNAPYGISVGPGEYLGEIQTNDDNWGSSPAPTNTTNDPGPLN